MSSLIRVVVAAVFGVALFVCGTMPADAATKLSEIQLEPAEFSAYRARIESELASGESLRELSADDRAALLQALDAMQHALDDDQLPAERDAAWASSEESVRTILQRGEADSRVVCRNEQQVGSNRRARVCQTVAQMRRRQAG